MNKLEYTIFIEQQKIRMEKGYLTLSERNKLKQMIDNPSIYIKEEKPIEVNPNILPIVTNKNLLQLPGELVTKDDNNIQDIVNKLKATLIQSGGIGLTANQIGINKRISYINIPKIVDKKIENTEYVLINARIKETDSPIKISNESCLSFPHVKVTTKRFVFIVVEYYNEKMELQTGAFQDLEALVMQHEIDHQFGITLFERKWVAK